MKAESASIAPTPSTTPMQSITKMVRSTTRRKEYMFFVLRIKGTESGT